VRAHDEKKRRICQFVSFRRAAKVPKLPGATEKIGAELLCFSELEATAQKKPELRHANFKLVYIYGRQRRQNCLIG
jgi:hypothetical protein